MDDVPLDDVSERVAANLGPSDGRADFLNETKALACYVSRRGNILGDAKGQGRMASFQSLQDAITAVEVDGQPDDWKNLIIAYSNVTAFTYADYEVNGRTILDTISESDQGKSVNRLSGVLQKISKPRYIPLLIGFLLLFGVLIYEGLLLHLESTYPNSDIFMSKFKLYLVPAVWGALGACVFLTKRISDKLSDYSFDQQRVRGIGTRIFLGAMLGTVVVGLMYYSSKSGGNALDGITPYLVAFLAGLGTKPVYAAIEGVVEGLASRIRAPWRDIKK